MTDLFTIENLANLGVLIFLQAVLGFDNLLYISIESKRAPQQYQAAVRRWGILIARTSGPFTVRYDQADQCSD